MLFDLRSRSRRRTVKVVYSFLALVMVSGLVLVGVGTGSSGGLLNGIGGTGSGGAAGVDYGPVKKDLAAVRKAPSSAAAWSQLVQDRYTVSQQGGNYNSTTNQYTASGAAQAKLLLQNWKRYLTLTQSPDPNVAILAARAAERIAQFGAAASAWEIVAASTKAAGQFYCLAVNAYAAKETRKGDLASAQVEQLAPKLQRLTLKQQLTAAKTSTSYAANC